MTVDRERARAWLRDGAYLDLFLEELGWDASSVGRHTVTVDERTYALEAVAHKRGLVAFLHRVDGDPPPDQIRGKIERRLNKDFREHLVIYYRSGTGAQIWEWAHREPGRPIRRRQVAYDPTNPRDSGEPLLQRLGQISFSLEQEADLALTDVIRASEAAFDVDKVTKRFYDRFKKEHAEFAKFLQGVPDKGDAAWYVSVMLNRLMFIYFIQKKGFLDGDPGYLRSRLDRVRRDLGPDRYYQDFLCPLFFEGFARREVDRSPAMRTLLGDVPYLDGGLFQRHQVEESYGQAIQIPDAALERVLNYFDEYDWHLDTRPQRDNNEINPDVLGYIFEKYINQKEMGAYYTKEDITGYISRNTIIPRLFDLARERYLGRAADNPLRPEGNAWTLLSENPDRYIYDAVSYGVEIDGVAQPLPSYIQAGVEDVAQRDRWNEPADATLALPKEIWRETVARRQRYQRLWEALVDGEVRQINDLITHNLDIEQFAQDVIALDGDAELVRAFWKALNEITVLDPTCGSGAFLFAALGILQPLYEACLERMRVLLGELPDGSQALPDFRQTLQDVEGHANETYYVLKRIMVGNLYGVDIMPEAVEIARLRMFLKLVAQVEEKKDLEPLPDIDFNLKAGNTLVGFATRADVGAALAQQPVRGGGASQGRMVEMAMENGAAELAAFEREADDAARLFVRFQALQRLAQGPAYEHDADPVRRDLRRRLRALAERADRLLAPQYGVQPGQEKAFKAWKKSHQPFHWFTEFYGIMSRGGFDVIIGNPPYVEYSKVKRQYTIQGYRTASCGNLHAFLMERCSSLMTSSGRVSLIVPMSAISSQRMSALQSEVIRSFGEVWLSHFAERPSQLFTGARPMLSIVVATCLASNRRIWSTTLYRWYADTRHFLFAGLSYAEVPGETIAADSIPKLGTSLDCAIAEELHGVDHALRDVLADDSDYVVLYNRSFLYWVKTFTFYPTFICEGTDRRESDDHQKKLFARSQQNQQLFGALLNSSLFYWYIIKYSNGREFTQETLMAFRVDTASMSDETERRLVQLSRRLMRDLDASSRLKTTHYKRVGTIKYQEFFFSPSKPIIDEIDRVLAQHYGFSDEELDYIINYDIKYRMGDALNDDEDGD